MGNRVKRRSGDASAVPMRFWIVGAAVLPLFARPGLCSDEALKEKVDAVLSAVMENRSAPATVVGVVTPDGTYVYSYGRLSASDPAPPAADTVFEIGSISKVFTGILLADMIARDEVGPDDLVRTCLPAGTNLPTHNGKEITLQHLATHASGLMRVPLILLFKGIDDPYGNEDAGRLYAVLDGMVLFSDPGEASSYSNLGFALLGQALVEKSGTDYQSLIVQRICRPLGLGDTCLTLSEDQRTRLAPGHRDGKAVPNWTFKAYAPAGAIRSTAADMCKFLRANMEFEPGPMSKVLREAQRPRVQMDQTSRVGFGWITTRLGEDKGEAVWHNGGTGGYASFVGFVKGASVGVVVLMNALPLGEGAETAAGFALLARLSQSDAPVAPSSAPVPPGS